MGARREVSHNTAVTARQIGIGTFPDSHPYSIDVHTRASIPASDIFLWEVQSIYSGCTAGACQLSGAKLAEYDARYSLLRALDI